MPQYLVMISPGMNITLLARLVRHLVSLFRRHVGVPLLNGGGIHGQQQVGFLVWHSG